MCIAGQATGSRTGRGRIHVPVCERRSLARARCRSSCVLSHTLFASGAHAGRAGESPHVPICERRSPVSARRRSSVVFQRGSHTPSAQRAARLHRARAQDGQGGRPTSLSVSAVRPQASGAGRAACFSAVATPRPRSERPVRIGRAHRPGRTLTLIREYARRPDHERARPHYAARISRSCALRQPRLDSAQAGSIEW